MSKKASSIGKDLALFRNQLEEGSIGRAYQAILSFMGSLRTHFKKSQPDSSVSAIYQGQLDITHFAIVPPTIKSHGLKVTILFNYESFRFEAKDPSTLSGV